ncbi:hypothetical protein ACFQZC_23090 [Streptacidiphilus monticola]
MSARAGLLAGRYLVTGRRGAGLEARDERSGAPVLLEELPLPEVVSPYDQLAAPAGLDEASGRALAHAAFVAETVPDHPRLCQAFQVFAEDGRLWVAGELVPGQSLAELLRAGPLSPYRAAELGHDLAAALSAVHRMGLVHGNVTPMSVTVCEDGTALLGGLALGAAQEALCGGPGLEEAGAGVSTALWNPARVRARDARAVIVGAVPERWAPEQAGVVEGAGLPVGTAADSWALGVLLHRAVTGEPPFPEGDAAALIAAVRGGAAYSAPRAAGPLAPLLARLLDADPLRRPDAVQVRAELRELLVRAPEPLEVLPTAAALLPGQRDERARVVRREQPVHHAAKRRRGAARCWVRCWSAGSLRSSSWSCCWPR